MERIQRNKRRGYLRAFIEFIIQNTQENNFFWNIRRGNIENYIEQIIPVLYLVSEVSDPKNYQELSFTTIFPDSTKIRKQLLEMEKNYSRKQVIL